MNVMLLVTLAVMFLAALFLTYELTDIVRERLRIFWSRALQREARAINELHLAVTPQRMLLLRLGLVGGGFVLGFLALNSALGLLLAGFGYLLPQAQFGRMRLRRRMRFTEQLVDGLELMGSSLKSGLTLVQAMELLVREFPAPISQEFEQVIADTRLGVEVGEALNRMAARLKLTVVDILASGVAITARCGGDLTQLFETIAETIRARATIEGKLNAVTAQGRIQGLVLGLMPFVLLFVLFFVDRPHVTILFEYTLGLMAVGLVVIMVLVAQLWIRKMVRIDV